MEMRIVPFRPAEAPQFNYDELKAELQAQLAKYENAIYSDDQIKVAKADKAALNKLRKAMNDERLRMEREYMAPFAEFKSKVNELIAMVDKPVGLIDAQVRDYDERRKTEKMQQIRDFFDRCNFNGIRLEQIMDQRWLNASTSMKSIEEAIEAKGAQIVKDLAVLKDLPEFAFEAEQVYMQTLDLAKAVGEAHRLQEMAERKAAYEAEQARRKAEQAAREAEQAAIKAAEKAPEPVHVPAAPVDEQGLPKTWLSFKALLSVDDALALREFFDRRGIEFAAL